MKWHPIRDAIFASAAVFFFLVLVAVSVLILVLILGLVLVAVLITVLVIHCLFLREFFLRYSALVACPKSYDLSFALKMRLASKPAVMAAAIPPALAVSPPVKIPTNPS